MKHHFDTLILLVSFLAFGILSLSVVGLIVLAIEVLSK
jgi:hypothetical protein